MDSKDRIYFASRAVEEEALALAVPAPAPGPPATPTRSADA